LDDAALKSSELALALHPFDQLRFGVMGTRACAYAMQGDYAQASHWAVQAAHAPHATAHANAIAAACVQLNGQHAAARAYSLRVMELDSSYSFETFTRAFPTERANDAPLTAMIAAGIPRSHR
jgi:hypothetical protein